MFLSSFVKALETVFDYRGIVIRHARGLLLKRRQDLDGFNKRGHIHHTVLITRMDSDLNDACP